jgi:hypothetical protein
MNQAFEMYANLIERFVSHQLPLQEFNVTFTARFLAETEPFEEPLFSLLDELFGDIDSFTDNPELLAEDCDFYLDEKGLRSKASDVLSRIRAWRAHRLTA